MHAEGLLVGKTGWNFPHQIPFFPNIPISSAGRAGFKAESPLPEDWLTEIFRSRTNSSHFAQFPFSGVPACSRRRRSSKKGPKQVRSATAIPKWYAGTTRAGKRQMSSNFPTAIALALAGKGLDAGVRCNHWPMQARIGYHLRPRCFLMTENETFSRT